MNNNRQITIVQRQMIKQGKPAISPSINAVKVQTRVTSRRNTLLLLPPFPLYFCRPQQIVLLICCSAQVSSFLPSPLLHSTLFCPFIKQLDYITLKKTLIQVTSASTLQKLGTLLGLKKRPESMTLLFFLPLSLSLFLSFFLLSLLTLYSFRGGYPIN